MEFTGRIFYLAIYSAFEIFVTLLQAHRVIDAALRSSCGALVLLEYMLDRDDQQIEVLSPFVTLRRF